MEIRGVERLASDFAARPRQRIIRSMPTHARSLFLVVTAAFAVSCDAVDMNAVVATARDGESGGNADRQDFEAASESAATDSTADSDGPANCGSHRSKPFSDCKFAWGAPNNANNTSYAFASFWVGNETNGGLASMSASAANVTCNACDFVSQLSTTNTIPVLYAYFIGFGGGAAGLPGCGTNDGGPDLCTGGAQYIRQNRAIIINQYAQYANAINAVAGQNSVIWWLEPNFVQYTDSTQSDPLSYAELGQLAQDIITAIKCNQPNSYVAINHSPWITDDSSDSFWSAMPMDSVDLVWVQGPGDSDTLVNSGSYNTMTANYAWLYQETGRKIMVDTEFASAGDDDHWTTATVAQINQRIANGVIGVNVTSPPGGYLTTISSLEPNLQSTCH
jgi:hypothetical protein